MDGWVDGWMDGWMDGRMDGWLPKSLQHQETRAEHYEDGVIPMVGVFLCLSTWHGVWSLRCGPTKGRSRKLDLELKGRWAWNISTGQGLNKGFTTGNVKKIKGATLKLQQRDMRWGGSWQWGRSTSSGVSQSWCHRPHQLCVPGMSQPLRVSAAWCEE